MTRAHSSNCTTGCLPVTSGADTGVLNQMAASVNNDQAVVKPAPNSAVKGYFYAGSRGTDTSIEAPVKSDEVTGSGAAALKSGASELKPKNAEKNGNGQGIFYNNETGETNAFDGLAKKSADAKAIDPKAGFFNMSWGGSGGSFMDALLKLIELIPGAGPALAAMKKTLG
jgi:hypothetical protein